MYSGNDAASAIATHIGGSTEKFVDMMNSYAAQLGCTGTHFTNPHGLQDENHYTTPYDIYLMLKEALRFPEFTEITQLGSYTISYQSSDGTEVNTPLTATDHYLTGEATAPKGITVLGENRNHQRCRKLSGAFKPECLRGSLCFHCHGCFHKRSSLSADEFTPRKCQYKIKNL